MWSRGSGTVSACGTSKSFWNNAVKRQVQSGQKVGRKKGTNEERNEKIKGRRKNEIKT